MEIRLVNNQELERKWQSYLQEHPQKSIYHTLKWRNLLKQEYDFKDKYLIAIKEEKVAGILPLFEIKNLSGKKLISIPCSQFGGDLSDNIDVTKKFLQFILNKKKEWDFDKVVIKENRKVEEKIRDFEIRNELLVCSLKTNESFELVKKNFSRNKRRTFKKAQDGNLSWKFCESEEELRKIYNLEVDLRKKQGVPIPSYQYFKSIYQNFGNENQLKIILTKDQKNEILAAEFYFTYNKEALNAYSVTHKPKYNPISPITFVQWQQIKVCSEDEKIDKVVYGTTDIHEKNILQFKQKWGSQCQEISTLYHPPKSNLTSSTKQGVLYKIFRKILKIIPKPIFRFTGKYIIKYLV